MGRASPVTLPFEDLRISHLPAPLETSHVPVPVGGGPVELGPVPVAQDHGQGVLHPGRRPLALDDQVEGLRRAAYGTGDIGLAQAPGRETVADERVLDDLDPRRHRC